MATLVLTGAKLIWIFSQQTVAKEVGVMWTPRKLILVRYNSRKSVIANMMVFGADFVRLQCKALALINVLVMGIAVEDFVR